MDWISGIQNAINYIEANLTEELDYGEISKKSFSSEFHFQRVFSLLSGYTLGEYIRNRRLTLAGAELSRGDSKVIDVALKYGYENPDSFARAFLKFHGILPSAARESGAKLRSFARLNIKITLEGGHTMEYRIENKPEMILTGYKRRFTGVPFGEERYKQEHSFVVTTRATQYFCSGIMLDGKNHYSIVKNIDDDGYDYYLAWQLDDEARADLKNSEVMGIENVMELFSLEEIIIPAATYVIFRTEVMRKPVKAYSDLRTQIVSEFLPGSGYKFADAPEVDFIHWQPLNEKHDRYIEIWMPVEKD